MACSAACIDVQPEYDCVIVARGTAGLTVLDRLTEDGKTTVVVIEHGEVGENLDHFVAS
jgi:choline dehydrogenase-like flavoprotein